MGFRPFVWQLAQQSARCGDVCNDGDGVLVRLLGDEAAFLAALTRFAAAGVSTAWKPGRFTGVRRRRISPSAKAAAEVCVPDCARCGHLPGVPAEMNNPQGAAIATRLLTVLTVGRVSPLFARCPMTAPLPRWLLFRSVRAARRVPPPRRPTFSCSAGSLRRLRPASEWRAEGASLVGEAALQAAIHQLQAGRLSPSRAWAVFIWCAMPAIRGGGGVTRTQTSSGKAAGGDAAGGGWLAEAAQALLTSPAAPIVLIEKSQVDGLCDDIAPALSEVGVMLPSNPLQHLVCRRWRALW